MTTSDPNSDRPTASLSERPERGDLLAEACPSREVLRHLTSRWGALALLALETETRRFGELRRMIGGVSDRMLAQTLQQLEGDGLVHRVVHRMVPPRVEYSLTPLGREATARVRALADWIESSLPRIEEGWRKREAAAAGDAATS